MFLEKTITDMMPLSTLEYKGVLVDCQGGGGGGGGVGESLRVRKSHHPDFNEVILLILVASFIAGC